MHAYFSIPGGVGRGAALKALREDLAGLVGEPVRTHDANFADVPLADFFATSESGRLYAVQWVDASDFSGFLMRTLGAYVRFHDVGREQAVRTFGLRRGFPPATLILVCNRVEDDWRPILSTLSLPVILVRAHALIDGNRNAAGCLFENRYSSGQSSETIARFLPRVEPAGAIAPSPTPADRHEEREEDRRPLRPGMSDVAGPSSTRFPETFDSERESPIPPGDDFPAPEPEDSPEGSPESSEVESFTDSSDEDAGPDQPEELQPEEWVDEEIITATGFFEAQMKNAAAISEREESAAEEAERPAENERDGRSEEAERIRHSWDTPAELLTDEETATFRLLENVLNN